jgi:hypothetical protein
MWVDFKFAQVAIKDSIPCERILGICRKALLP